MRHAALQGDECNERRRENRAEKAEESRRKNLNVHAAPFSRATLAKDCSKTAVRELPNGQKGQVPGSPAVMGQRPVDR